MVLIKVFYFATYKQKIGIDREEIEIEKPTKVKEFKNILVAKYPNVILDANSLLVSINRKYALDEDLILDGDQVAIFPPISGGDLSSQLNLGIYCRNCGSPYPDQGVPYRCLKCGGVYQIKKTPQFNENSNRELEGIWSSLDLSSLGIVDNLITLGEGNTPLLLDNFWATKKKDVYYKCEYQNPTGSFKDRGSAALITLLQNKGIKEIYEDSSGNAGASIAAYAARAGMKAHIYIPAKASCVKREQIKRYGAEIVSIEGKRSEVSEKLIQDYSQNKSGEKAYASHAYSPFNLLGYSTIAYELIKQLGKVPETVIAPVGQGGGLLGVYHGFKSLYDRKLISFLPVLIGVQASACAPLWAAFEYGPSGLQWIQEGETVTEGIRIKNPIRGDEVLEAIRFTNGRLYIVEEDEILDAGNSLAQRGFWIEPTSAVVEAAMKKYIAELQPPIVAILTGSGYKTLEVYG